LVGLPEQDDIVMLWSEELKVAERSGVELVERAFEVLVL
jgi:hypothetical protein